MSFLQRMKEIRDNVSGYPDSDMNLGIEDFIRLVDMAEDKAITDRLNSELYATTSQVKRDVQAQVEAIKMHSDHILMEYAIAWKIMTQEQRDKHKEIMEEWSVADAVAFINDEAEQAGGMKFNVTAISDCVGPYRGILERYNPEWSYSFNYEWRNNVTEGVDTEAVITLHSLEDITRLIQDIKTLNEGTDRWEKNGVIIDHNNDDPYPTIRIYDGWYE